MTASQRVRAEKLKLVQRPNIPESPPRKKLTTSSSIQRSKSSCVLFRYDPKNSLQTQYKKNLNYQQRLI